MGEDWVVLCQALYQSIGDEEWSTRSLKRSVQKCRSQKSQSQSCWIMQAGVAQVRKGTFLLAKETSSNCFQQEVSVEGVVVGNVEREHTQSAAHL